MQKPNTFLWFVPMTYLALTSLGCTKSDSLGAAGNYDSGVAGGAGSGGATGIGGATVLPEGGNSLIATGGATAQPGGGYSLIGTGGATALPVGGYSLVETGGATATGGAGLGGAPASCPLPTTTSGPLSTTFRFRNSGSAPVFLHTECGMLSYQVSSCTSGYTDQVAVPVFCPPCLCGVGCVTCGMCAPDIGVQVAPGTTTQVAWDASLLVQQPGGDCSTKVGLPAGLYRVSIPIYATQADATAQSNPLRVLTTDFSLSSTTTVVDIINNATVPDGGTASSWLLDMLPADDEVDTWVHAGGVSLITDQTGLYNRIDGGAPKYIDRGWVGSVYANYSQGARTIQVAIHDMGSAANAQAIYNYALPASRQNLSTLPYPVLDTGLSDAYAAYSYVYRFYIEINIDEKSDTALTTIEMFIDNIRGRILSRTCVNQVWTGGANDCSSSLPLPCAPCIACDPLPTGSTGGCPAPDISIVTWHGGGVDLSLRYPVGCVVTLPTENSAYPGGPQPCNCDADALSWLCPL